MKIFENIYLSYYFLVRNDKYLSKTWRVQFLIETILFMLSSSILCLIFGILNIRTDNIIMIAIFLSVSYFIALRIKKLIIGNGKEQIYIISGMKYNSKSKKIYGVIGLLGILISFVLLILSAILMSYFWSLELL